jgi:hypothetical protein
MGKPKAAVLPLPVFDSPMRSRPARRGGIERAWIGVGWVKPISPRTACEAGERPRSEKRISVEIAGVSLGDIKRGFTMLFLGIKEDLRAA